MGTTQALYEGHLEGPLALRRAKEPLGAGGAPGLSADNEKKPKQLRMAKSLRPYHIQLELLVQFGCFSDGFCWNIPCLLQQPLLLVTKALKRLNRALKGLTELLASLDNELEGHTRWAQGPTGSHSDPPRGALYLALEHTQVLAQT